MTRTDNANNKLQTIIRLPLPWVAAMIFVTCLLLPAIPRAQDGPDDYEEITVLLTVQDLEGYEINAVFADEKVYVSVTELFQFLKISNRPSAYFDTVSGFFLHEENHYQILAAAGIIQMGAQEFRFDKKEIFRDGSGLYLRTDVYGEAFGLHLEFNFRNLALELETSHELPVLRELRLEQMRKNINRISGVAEADTTLKRQYHLYSGTMLDWSLISTQSPGTISDTRASVGFGSELFGGEANVLLNYSNKQGFDGKQQQYRWRWANNEKKLVRQISAGKIPSRAISSIYAPLIGASVSNTPTTYRKTFGSYTLTDYTEPGWTVELYINNVIVDYTTADASGFFSFQVPLVYGSSAVTLRFYGPWGEERIKEQTINIPYNFLPLGRSEYTLTGGVVRDSSNSTFMKGETYYGLHRNITIGGGFEYLSSVTTGKAMPFLGGSARFLKYFLANAEYTHGVRTKGILSYRLPSNLTFELDYTKYVKGQKAISFNYLEERKASLSIPIRIHSFRIFSRLSYKQNVLTEVTYSTTEVLFSTYVRGMSANFSGYANWLGSGKPYMYSNLALGFKIGHGATFRPQIQYDFSNSQVISYKAEFEKNILQKAYLSVGYEENIRSDFRSIELTFRYDLSFAQTSASARMINKDFVATESARGSFAFGSGKGYIHSDNRSVSGRAGITLVPFLDMNHNGNRDDNEPLAAGLNIQMNGGRMVARDRDTLIRVMELEPFTNYYLEIDDNGFENISWQIESKVLNVYTDPNQFKTILIPIKVMGEANGLVYINTGRSLRGQGRMLINFFNTSGKFVTKTLTEPDGYFNYLGLAPGKYIARPDSAQMNRLGVTADPEFYEFEIKPMEMGDIVDDLMFTMTSKNPVKQEEPAIKMNTGNKETDNSNENQTIRDESVPLPVPEKNPEKPDFEVRKLPGIPVEIISGNIDPAAGNCFVQAGAFENPGFAMKLAEKLCAGAKVKCGVVLEDKLYKVRFGYFTTEAEARQSASLIGSEGYYVFIGIVNN
ncbi:MAG: SPOR domain-containing protein [Bacteroidota bacterium]